MSHLPVLGITDYLPVESVSSVIKDFVLSRHMSGVFVAVTAGDRIHNVL